MMTWNPAFLGASNSRDIVTFLDVHRGDEFDIFRLFWESLLNFRCTVFSNEYHTSRIWYQCLRWNMKSNWETYCMWSVFQCSAVWKKAFARHCEVVLFMMQYTLEVPLVARHLCNNSNTYHIHYWCRCLPRPGVHTVLQLDFALHIKQWYWCHHDLLISNYTDVHRGVFESSVFSIETIHPNPSQNLWRAYIHIEIVHWANIFHIPKRAELVTAHRHEDICSLGLKLFSFFYR